MNSETRIIYLPNPYSAVGNLNRPHFDMVHNLSDKDNPVFLLGIQPCKVLVHCLNQDEQSTKQWRNQDVTLSGALSLKFCALINILGLPPRDLKKK